MDKAKGISAESFKDKLVIAKLLLRKYGMMHELHMRQSEVYPVACCPIAIDGEAEVNVDSRSVVYRVYTNRFYKEKGSERIELPVKFNFKSPFDFTWLKIKFGKKEYKQQVDLASINLNTWTKELLWGDETSIKVIVDGREISNP